jgi:hypothetical protein
MKRIFERWDSYLIFEEDTLSKLKNDPAAVEELADDIAAIKDRKRLQAILTALSTDKQILQVVRDLNQLKDETQEEMDESLSDEFLKMSTKGYLGIQNFMDSEVGKRTMKVAPPLLALAVIVSQLTGDGFTPDDAKGVEAILKTTGKNSVQSALTVLGQSAETAMTEKKWSY